MEGRTIARPDFVQQQTGGTVVILLQWRAGQLPGQTNLRSLSAEMRALASTEGRTIARPDRSAASPIRRRSTRASMEGRTIARPDYMRDTAGITVDEMLQWRAGQLPGQTDGHESGALPTGELQWRAGQLPGQTSS